MAESAPTAAAARAQLSTQNNPRTYATQSASLGVGRGLTLLLCTSIASGLPLLKCGENKELLLLVVSHINLRAVVASRIPLNTTTATWRKSIRSYFGCQVGSAIVGAAMAARSHSRTASVKQR